MGWYEDWQRQNLAFTPRMDQGGGEYTGYIKDVYEGDDAQPGQEFFPGPDLNQQARMGMRTPLDIAAARKVNGRYGSGSPGAQALMSAGQYQKLGDSPNVGNLDYQQNLREPAGVATGNNGSDTAAVANGLASPFDPGGGDHSVNWYDTVKDIYGFGAEALKPLSEVQNSLVEEGAGLARQVGDAIPEYLKDPLYGAYDTVKGWVNEAGRYPPYGDLLDKSVASIKNAFAGGASPAASAGLGVGATAPGVNTLGGDPFSEDDNLPRAVQTRIFPAGASEAPVTVDPAREASDRNLQDILAARDRGEITPIGSPGEVDAEAPQSLSEMLGAGPAAAAFATTTTAAVGGAELLRREGVKTWRNSTKGQLSQLRKDLAANTKAMATENPNKFRSHTRATDAHLKTKIAELESKETRRQQARAFINKQLNMAKGGLTKFGKTTVSGLKKGLLGAVPAAALGGVAYASWKYGISRVDAATTDGILGDVSGMSEEERIAALYEASAIGDLDGTAYENFASRMDQFDTAGDTASGVAELLNPMGGTSGKTTTQMGPLSGGRYKWSVPYSGSGSIDPNWMG
jgi:hypothetical protein